MSTKKTLKDQIKEMEDLKMRLEAMEQAIADARQTTMEEIKSRFDLDLVNELHAIEVNRLVIDIDDEGSVTVSFGKARGGGNGKKARFEGTLERKYKEKVYKATMVGDEIRVDFPDGHTETFTSLTAAAQGVIKTITGKQGNVNGKAWWKLS